MYISGNVMRMARRFRRVFEGNFGERAPQYLRDLHKFAIAVWGKCKITAKQTTTLSPISIDINKEIGLDFPKITAILRQNGIDILEISIQSNNYAYELRPVIGYAPEDLRGPEDFINTFLSSPSIVDVNPFSRLFRAVVRDLANASHLRKGDFKINLQARGMEFGLVNSVVVEHKGFEAFVRVQYLKEERKAILIFSI